MIKRNQANPPFEAASLCGFQVCWGSSRIVTEGLRNLPNFPKKIADLAMQYGTFMEICEKSARKICKNNMYKCKIVLKKWCILLSSA